MSWRYNDSKVVVGILRAGHSRICHSLYIISVCDFHILWMENNTHDVHNEQGENITIYEKQDLWQSPAEPLKWDQGVARRY